MKTQLQLHATGLLGLTMGDAAGIGPELVVRLFSQGLPGSTVVYGDAGAVSRAVAQLGLGLPVTSYGSVAQWRAAQPNRSNSTEIPVICCTDPLPANLVLGQVNPQAGLASYRFLMAAISDAMDGSISAIVTAPINKLSLKAGGVNFPGHTEILAHAAGVPRVAMMLLNEQLRVILVTIHVALCEVPALITYENELHTIRLADRACRMLGLVAPVLRWPDSIRMLARGRFGHEEDAVIWPAIAAARDEGLDVSGPYPGDTVFMRARRGEFDIVVAQYHDQGLIPLKYLGIDKGVNVTVGLPFIRTSVDHGTAYDIAGKGVADPSSLRVACELALQMCHSGI